MCVCERENVIHGMCALKLDACVNSAGGGSIHENINFSIAKKRNCVV